MTEHGNNKSMTVRLEMQSMLEIMDHQENLSNIPDQEI